MDADFSPLVVETHGRFHAGFVTPLKRLATAGWPHHNGFSEGPRLGVGLPLTLQATLSVCRLHSKRQAWRPCGGCKGSKGAYTPCRHFFTTGKP